MKRFLPLMFSMLVLPSLSAQGTAPAPAPTGQQSTGSFQYIPPPRNVQEVTHRSFDVDLTSAFTSDDFSPNLYGLTISGGPFLDDQARFRFLASIGFLFGSEDIWYSYYGGRYRYDESVDVWSVPILAGFSYHIPVSDPVELYVSAQGGFSMTSCYVDGMEREYRGRGCWEYTYDQTDVEGMFTGGAGIRVRVNSQWAVNMGYEFWRIYSHNYLKDGPTSYHTVKLGATFRF